MVSNPIAVSTWLMSVVPNLDDRTDDRLLSAFFHQHDEAAFATLVQRHQRTVWNVCRRVLHNNADAEDAFQATFIVLAKSGRMLADRGSIGGWLYRVAFRVAQKALIQVNKRRHKEQRAAKNEASNEKPNDHADLLAIISEELDRLSEEQRLAVIVCDLDGLSRTEAAERLGWNEGTLSARLHRGRKKLAERLKARGVTVPTVSLGLIAGTCSNASAALLATTTQSAIGVITHGAIPKAVSSSVTGLVADITKEMTVRITTKILASALLLVGVLGTGWMGVQGPLESRVVAAPVPEKKVEGKKLELNELEMNLLRNRRILRELKLSPEQRVAIEDHFDDQADALAGTLQGIQLNLQGGNFNNPQNIQQLEDQIKAQVKERRDKVFAENRAVIEKVMKPEQVARLRQIELQIGGANSLTTESVAMALQLTETQKKLINDLIEESNKAQAVPGGAAIVQGVPALLPPGGAVPGGRVVMGRAIAGQMDSSEARKKLYEQSLEKLTKEQQATWKKIIGEPMTYNPFSPALQTTEIRVGRGVQVIPAGVGGVIPPLPPAPPAPPAAPEK